MKNRTSSKQRVTRETDIRLALNLDGRGARKIDIGVPFMNHMLELLAVHSLVDLDLAARGDLAVDYHHTVEDVGLVLGDALSEALGERKGIRRYGWCLLPMDEALSQVAIDLGGRPYLVYSIQNKKQKIRDFDLGLVEEFFRAFCTQGRFNLHIAQLYGKDPHHAYESVFKAVARALRMACEPDPRTKSVPSSKGALV